MAKISSIKKGDSFEKEIFDIFKSKLSKEELFISGKMSKIFTKKAYYSKDRGSNIVVDISIETTMPNANSYSLLTVFECKNYGKTHTVPIDDIEEFAQKLSQIAGYNVKGIMVTSSQYSSTGLQYARNKGIGLIRIFNNEVIYEANRKARFGEQTNHENICAVICGESVPTKQYYIADHCSFDNILSYFHYLNIIDQKPSEKGIDLKVPYLSLEKIEKVSEQIIGTESLKLIQPTSLITICRDLSNKQKLKIVTNENLGYSGSKEILGKISFSPKCIYVTNNLEEESHRWRFTFAHEIGHYVLHSKILSKNYKEAIDMDSSINNEIMIDDKSIKRIEYQANIFAGALLMPYKSFMSVAYDVFQQNRVNKGRLYLDNQSCNKELFYKVAGEISSRFNVSLEAVKYRLIAFNLLENHSGSSIRDILF